jgi:hypothetical protein
MFVMHMPESFKIGDTTDCVINGETAQLTWLGPDIMVIGEDDARYIIKTHLENGLRVFFCGDADNSQYSVEDVPGEGFIIFPESKGKTS